jgi:hypothetical protein
MRSHSIQKRAHLNRNPVIGKVFPDGKDAIRGGEHGFLKRTAHLAAINVKGGYHLDVLRIVTPRFYAST